MLKGMLPLPLQKKFHKTKFGSYCSSRIWNSIFLIAFLTPYHNLAFSSTRSHLSIAQIGRDPAATAQTHRDWLPELESVDGDTLVFKANSMNIPTRIKTGLAEVKFFGFLKNPGNRYPKSNSGTSPYLVVSGKRCQNCLDATAVYLLRDGNLTTAVVYPGKIYNPEQPTGLLLESRTFYGQCLAGKGDLLVTFQREQVDRRHHPQSSVLIIEPADDHPREVLLERRLPSLKWTLQKVKQKHCFEIPGFRRPFLPKPLDLHPKASLEETDDDDEPDDSNSETKENHPKEINEEEDEKDDKDEK